MKAQKTNMKIKHLLLLAGSSAVASFLLIGATVFNNPATVHAGGPGSYNANITPSTTSLAVGQTVTVAVYQWVYVCNDSGYWGGGSTYCDSHGGVSHTEANPSDAPVYATVSGSGNTLSSANPISISNGSGSFTLSSSVAGTKTITIYEANPNCDCGAGTTQDGSISITFTASAAAAPATTHTTTSHASTPTTSASTPASPPAVPLPSIAQLKVGTKVVSSTQPVTVQARQPLVLSGTTIANGIVTLYIHSTLRTVTVNADKNGAWKYIVTKLPVGSHHIDAQITDPATKLQSGKVSLLDFSVIPTKNLVTVAAAKNTFNPWATIAISVAALGVLIAAVYGWRRYRRHQPPSAINMQATTTATTGSGK